MPTVRCPTCQRQAEFSSDNPWRPFCSERCKLIDLGEWAQEKHAIPGQPETPGGDFTPESSGGDSSSH